MHPPMVLDRTQNALKALDDKDAEILASGHDAHQAKAYELFKKLCGLGFYPVFLELDVANVLKVGGELYSLLFENDHSVLISK
jgi:hypothetical protein